MRVARVDADVVEHPVGHPQRRRQVQDRLLPGDVVGDAELVRLHRAGGVGAVALVERTVLGRLVRPPSGDRLVEGPAPPQRGERVADPAQAARLVEVQLRHHDVVTPRRRELVAVVAPNRRPSPSYPGHAAPDPRDAHDRWEHDRGDTTHGRTPPQGQLAGPRRIDEHGAMGLVPATSAGSAHASTGAVFTPGRPDGGRRRAGQQPGDLARRRREDPRQRRRRPDRRRDADGREHAVDPRARPRRQRHPDDGRGQRRAPEGHDDRWRRQRRDDRRCRATTS